MYAVIATPKAAALNQTPQYAWAATKAEAQKIAKDQRSRRIWRSVKVTQETQYHYTLKSTGDSHAKYGPCEVCGGEPAEVFHQIETRQGTHGLTHEGCRDLFGHRECLEEKQR